MDILNIAFQGESFDIVYCSHVLEHIEDDQRAIKELYRVLKSNGWALIVVPINIEKTYENSEIQSLEDRLEVFGQSDHVRICGLDYKERLINNGFYVKEYQTDDIATGYEKDYFDLKEGILYFCTKIQN